MWKATVLSAAVTFAVVMGLGAAKVLVAEAVKEPAVKGVDRPMLVTGGCEVELRREGQAKGGEATVVLVVTNRTQAAADLELTVNCMMRKAVSPMSRMMPMPEQVWSKPVACHVEAGGTAKVVVSDEAAKPAASKQQAAPESQVVQKGEPTMWFTVSDGERQIMVRPDEPVLAGK